MATIGLRCTSCGGPLTAAHAGIVKCPYCAASVVVRGAGGRTVDHHVVRLARVSISNREGIARVLVEHVRIDAAAAAQLVLAAPCEVLASEDANRARLLRNALVEAGASAEIEIREVPVE